MQYQIVQRREEYTEALRLFREVIGVERALIQQIVGAIESKYLKELRNPVTNKITKTIPEIFDYYCLTLTVTFPLKNYAL